MPGKLRIQPSGNIVIVPEEHIGTATSQICYPQIQSCISLTVLGPIGMTGAHVTMYTEDHIVDDILTRLAAADPTIGYVVGGIQFFKGVTPVTNFNTRKKMQKQFKARMPSLSTVLFYDTWVHSKDVNLGAFANGTQIDFRWSPGANVNWNSTPDMSSYTPIPQNSLVKR